MMIEVLMREFKSEDVIERFCSLFRLRYLGLGFMWAWIFYSWQTSALFADRQGQSINSDPSWIFSALSVAIGLIAFALLLRGKPIAQRRSNIIAAAIVTAAGTLLSGLSALFFPSDLLPHMVSGVLTGFGSAGLLLLWAEEFTRFETEHLEAIVPASGIVTVICYVFITGTSGISSLISVVLLPLISGVLLLFTEHDSTLTRISPAGKTSQPLLLRNLVLNSIAIGSAYIIISIADSSTGASAASTSSFLAQLPMLAGALFAVGLSAASISFSIRVDLNSLFRWVTPLLVIAALLFMGDTDVSRSFSDIFMSIADMAFSIFIFIYYVSLARRKLFDAVFGVGIALGAAQVGILVGNVIGATATAHDVPLMWTMGGAICLLVFCTMLVPSRESIQGLMKNRDLADVDKVDVSSRKGDELDMVCDQIATLYGLSNREREVLGYLSHGRSQPYIRDALFLSKNTVASHVKHLYAKLDVHSRQRLLDFIESFEAQR
jgi:DNA-binding CsgD family transcriptional regulator